MNAISREKYEAPVFTIETVEVHLDAAISSLIEKIDKANERLAAADAALGAKIDKLTEIVLVVQGHQKAMLWVFSACGIVASLVSIARTLNWI